MEIAIVDGEGRVLLDTLVRPRHEIPAEATRIHGISTADVRQAPSWADIHATVCRTMQHRTIVVYNASFDRRLVGQSCELHGLDRFEADWQCAMLRFAAFRGEFGTGRQGFRLHTLETAVRTVGGNPGDHRALGDALACRTVVVAIAAASDDVP